MPPPPVYTVNATVKEMRAEISAPLPPYRQ
jgi:hypothetical protein